MQLPTLRKKSLVNLTPLIDVVFILLIFFMLASNFMRWDILELSITESAEVEVNPQSLSVITVLSDSSYLLNKQQMPVEKIITILRSKIDKQADHPILIQPEQGANVQALVDILNQIKQFAAENISISKPDDLTSNNL